MCGISGIAVPGCNRQQLMAMVESMNHRGPDDQGVFVDEDRNIGLGHNRLSIIDLSQAGHQPMCNQNKTIWLVFNGEIYNYPELRRELLDYPYHSNTDTEVILAAYEKWGIDCLSHLIGMFAFALWDEHKQSLFLVRDRFGVKPLFYHEKPDGTILFASEIKALHSAGVPKLPDETAWSTYLATGMYDHEERTFWKDIHLHNRGS